MSRDHQITYARAQDKRRITFSYPAEYFTLQEALVRAASMAPFDFEHVATKADHTGPMRIPFDGDDYGDMPTAGRVAEWRSEFAQMIARYA